jgi:hypothetical protein
MKHIKKLIITVILPLYSSLCYAPELPIEVVIEIGYRIDIFKINKLLMENDSSKLALGMYESNMRPTAYNRIGAMGCYQFMNRTLRDFGYGYITVRRFRRNPNIFPKELQDQLLQLKINSDIKMLRAQWWRPDSLDVDYIDKYVGTEIQGVKVSLFGLLAASHIAGSYGTIRYIENNKYNPKDINGKGASDYIRMFSKYNYTEPKVIEQKFKCAKERRDAMQKLWFPFKDRALNGS